MKDAFIEPLQNKHILEKALVAQTYMVFTAESLYV